MTTHAITHSLVVSVDAAAPATSRAASPSHACVVLTSDGTWVRWVDPDCGVLPVAPVIPPIAPPPPPPQIADPAPEPMPTGRRRHRVRQRH
jgi:hypothetical protein